MSEPLPFRIAPMLLAQRREPFDGERWLFEPKWDGWRCLAVAHGGRASLYSRNGNHLTRRFPTVAAALSSLLAGTVLDGELVILDRDGCPDFSALMRQQGAVPPGLRHARARRPRPLRRARRGKRLGSRYLPGQRTGAWVKVKVPGYARGRADWFRQTRSELAC